jgi:hypothetical protein
MILHSSMVKLYTITLSQLRQIHEARFTCCKTSLWGKKLTEKKIILHFNVSVCFSNCTNILFFNTKCMTSTSCGYYSLCMMLIPPSHICTQNLIYHSKMGSEDKISKLLTFKVVTFKVVLFLHTVHTLLFPVTISN